MMLTVREVAAQLRVSATCVYQLIEADKIACHRIGLGRGAIRVAESDLTAFVDGCRREPSERHEASRPVRRLKHLKQ
jgi:excisionase family DNA binding protein